jgi:thiamine biosynthesis lipoprotein ApbE
VAGTIAAWSAAPDTTTADALSTAFMVMTAEEIEQYCSGHPYTSAMTMLQQGGEEKVLRFGSWKNA